MVDISLVGSQVGFVCAYIYFIANALQSIILEATADADGSNGTYVNKWWFGLLCFCIYVPLCFIRKIQKLAPTHLFADAMIVLTIVTCISYASANVHN